MKTTWSPVRNPELVTLVVWSPSCWNDIAMNNTTPISRKGPMTGGRQTCERPAKLDRGLRAAKLRVTNPGFGNKGVGSKRSKHDGHIASPLAAEAVV